jgi:FkbM family methyltransferase|tara:strand:- start:564 stop:1172 length:609 start_codon:yes stop_codon:yes gene_type:complete
MVTKDFSRDIDKDFLSRQFEDIPIGRALIIGVNQGDNNPAWNLIESGWKAVVCEPDPFAISILIEKHSKYADNLTIVNSAISPTTGSLLPFYLSIGRSAMSSLQRTWLRRQKQIPIEERQQRQILTHTLSFQQLLDHVGTDFDLVVIDAEGMDAELIGSIDWTQLDNCRMVCVEQIGDSHHSFNHAGFKLVHTTPMNFYFKN